MENDREYDQVMYNIQRQGGSIVSLLLFTAKMQMQMYVFLARMVKKAFVSSGVLGRYETFLQKTEGKYNIYNIPIPEAHTDKVMRLQALEEMLDKEKNPLRVRELKKKIEGIKNEVPEIKELEKLGISHFVLPKLNGGENTLQVAIGKNDLPNFKVWYMNHINDTLSGGEVSLEELKRFTEGNYSIFNMPFEGDEVQKMLHDFDILGINYTLLPDLNVGDGYTQIAVANKDQAGMDGWFRLWKEGQLQAGLEPGDYQKISESTYLETSAIDTEDYIAGTDQKYQDANNEFENSPGAVQADLPKDPQQADTGKNADYEKLDHDPDFVKISINRKTLVDHTDIQSLSPEIKQAAEEQGLFLSRIPGKYGRNMEMTAIPKSRVFVTDEGQTFIAFLPKNEKTLVGTADGNFFTRPFADVYAPYHEVSRGLKKIENLVVKSINDVNINETKAPQQGQEISVAKKTAHGVKTPGAAGRAVQEVKTPETDGRAVQEVKTPEADGRAAQEVKTPEAAGKAAYKEPAEQSGGLSPEQLMAAVREKEWSAFKDSTSPEYAKMAEDWNYQKITIGAEQLEGISNKERQHDAQHGFFSSKIPLDSSGRRLIIPSRQVFRSQDGASLVGFLPRNDSVMTQYPRDMATGKPGRIERELSMYIVPYYNEYDRTKPSAVKPNAPQPAAPKL